MILAFARRRAVYSAKAALATSAGSARRRDWGLGIVIGGWELRETKILKKGNPEGLPFLFHILQISG